MPEHLFLSVNQDTASVHTVAKEVARHAQGSFSEITIRLAADLLRPIPPDSILVNFWWGDTCRLRANTKAKVVVTCVHDCESFHGPLGMTPEFRMAYLQSDILSVSDPKIAATITGFTQGLKQIPIFVCQNGVNETLFKYKKIPQGPLIVGWTGNSASMGPTYPDYKGLGLIRKACCQEMANVELQILDTGKGNGWPVFQMPDFYHGGSSCILCMARDEGGGPFPIFEGMSCGLIPISVRVGAAARAIRHGNNGFLVPERSAEALTQILRHVKALTYEERLQISADARRTIEDDWTWAKVMPAWNECLNYASRLAAGETSSTFAGAPAARLPNPPQNLVERVTIPNRNSLESREQIPDLRQWTRFHLGCGSRLLTGWCNIDIAAPMSDVRADSLTLTLPARHAEEIYSSHMLEHVFPEDTLPLLKKWFVALRPGGVLRLSVPDLRLIVANTVDSHAYGPNPNPPLFGDFRAVAAPQDRHRQAFTIEILTGLLQEAGFIGIEPWRTVNIPQIHALRDWASYETISLNLIGVKPVTEETTPEPVPESVPESSNPSQVEAMSLPEDSAEPLRPILISVITGTYNRLASLQRFVSSVRVSLGKYLSAYEIILADGGSTDGTREWIQSQMDCLLVEGGLTGAIDALNIAYLASTGESIFQGNDDIEVVGNSIEEAFEELRKNTRLGQVCFEFTMDGGRTWTAPHHQTGRKLIEGTPHPNVALTRRLALEDVRTLVGGFWGDKFWRIDKTYAGDTLQGAALAKAGWKSTYLPGRVRVIDYLHKDELRRSNVQEYGPKHNNGSFDNLVSSLERIPSGDWWPRVLLPEPGKMPRRSPIPAGPQERLLLLPLAHQVEPQLGLRRAFQRIGPTEEVLRLGPSLGALGQKAQMDAIFAAAKRLKPTLVWIQSQSDEGPISSTGFFEKLRTLCDPKVLIATWNGDVNPTWYPTPPSWMVETGRAADLSLHSNLDYPRVLLHTGVPRPGYLQVGYDCGIDDVIVPPLGAPPRDPYSDRVVFLGSKTALYPERTATVEHVLRECPNFHVYGFGWNEGPQTHPIVPRKECGYLYRSSALGVNASISANLEAYSSDRLNRLGGAGACIALQRFKGQEHWGLIDGENCLCWSTAQDLVDLIRDWTRRERVFHRENMQLAVAGLAKTWWTWEAVAEMYLAIVRYERYRTGRMLNP